MKEDGFTLIELLIALFISLIILGSITIAFIASNKSYQVNRPLSQAIEEVQTAESTLNFLFSRWGVGVPTLTNTTVINNYTIPTSYPENSYPFPPTNPFWFTITNNNEIAFFASLGGSGFVTGGSSGNYGVLSCRLSNNDENNKDFCYFVFSPSGSVSYMTLNSSELSDSDNNKDCINFPSNNQYNVVINSSALSVGDRIQRVPDLIKIYELDRANQSWLVFDKVDLADDCNNSENGIYIGRIQKGSFNVTQLAPTSILLKVNFVAPNGKIYNFSRVYSK
jgi:prepilin-type N-terminal cleavage/methylation domain-containing protein